MRGIGLHRSVYDGCIYHHLAAKYGATEKVKLKSAAALYVPSMERHLSSNFYDENRCILVKLKSTAALTAPFMDGKAHVINFR